MHNRYHEKKEPELAQGGVVLLSGKNGVNVSADVDAARMEQAAPYGVYSKPCERDEVLLLPTAEGKYVLLGTVGTGGDIEAGEVLLRSAGGAYIRLCSDGTVEINGLVVSGDGKIL